MIITTSILAKVACVAAGALGHKLWSSKKKKKDGNKRKKTKHRC